MRTVQAFNLYLGPRFYFSLNQILFTLLTSPLQLLNQEGLLVSRRCMSLHQFNLINTGISRNKIFIAVLGSISAALSLFPHKERGLISRRAACDRG